jgi:outer membrane protein assembly factor BamB
MDMDGQILHEWTHSGTSPAVRERAIRRDLYPELPELPVYFRRTHLYPNGNLLVQRDFQSLLLLDKGSKVLWEFEDATHHDMHVNADGTIYVLTRTWRVFPWFHEKQAVADDDVVKLGPDGRELGRVSVLNAAIKGMKSGLLKQLKDVHEQRGKYGIDLIHTNAIDVMPSGVAAKVDAFQPGRLLLSARSVNALMLLDFEQEKIVWWTQGSYVGQHDSRFLPNGNILLFDNLGTPGRSAVVELDPATGEEVWAYRGTDEQPFHTMCCGTARRLANGNTLIVETEKGRAFEVTPEKEIVWEFVSPHKVKSYGALLQDLLRLPADPRPGW